MGAYDTIRAAVQAAADIAGGLQRILLGTPGQQLLWPPQAPGEDEGMSRPRDTGEAWVGQLIPPVLTQVGAVIDALGVGPHAASHVTGADQLADAVGGGAPVHGLLAAADKLKLDGIEAGADVTSAHAPQAHQASHVSGGDQVPVATSLTKGLCPQLSGDATQYLDGSGAFSAPARENNPILCDILHPIGITNYGGVSITVGCTFAIRRPCTLTKVVFERAASGTVRIRVWNPAGVAQAIGAAGATYIDVVCGGAGRYTCTLVAPITFTYADGGGAGYGGWRVSMYNPTAAEGYSRVVSPGQHLFAACSGDVPLNAGDALSVFACCLKAAGGDVCPTDISLFSSVAYPIDPILVY